MKFLSHSLQKTFEIASTFTKQLKGGEVIALIGDLGAGKTHFVKGMAQALGINEEEVTSPTFSLMQIYAGAKTLVHLDLYRLENLAQLQELGFEDYLQTENIVVVEWADKFIQDLSFDFRVEIRKVDTTTREIEIH
ncbi:MAG: tRNA (adenosine(37)-N6)-threonylcarbamoyltransferase complex ATPase subunit type 1 TsaE [Deltaproteobacteria bacterium]|nr:tRNA (adenosine(37)-N6)-threonylcarbamoyltransferase complex ATPase subunit type 1 TsaE [Deltaproteobacteria bacterium]